MFDVDLLLLTLEHLPNTECAPGFKQSLSKDLKTNALVAQAIKELILSSIKEEQVLGISPEMRNLSEIELVKKFFEYFDNQIPQQMELTMPAISLGHIANKKYQVAHNHLWFGLNFLLGVPMYLDTNENGKFFSLKINEMFSVDDLDSLEDWDLCKKNALSPLSFSHPFVEADQELHLISSLDMVLNED